MRSKFQIVASVVLVLACAALLAACGSSGSSSGASSGATTASTPDASTQTSSDGTSTGAAPGTQNSLTDANGNPKIQFKSAPPMTIDKSKNYTATLVTNKGTIVVQLEPKSAPIAVNNFVFLANKHFYDGVPFHRIVQGFVIQTGDPTGTGLGGPGYTIGDDKTVGNYTPGVLAMANTGQPHSGGSQFFITLADLTHQLPKNYPIFGKVTSGMNVVRTIGATPTTDNGQGEQSKPTQPVTLEKVTIAVS